MLVCSKRGNLFGRYAKPFIREVVLFVNDN